VISAITMIDIGFYQLAQRRAEAVLPALVGKALMAGHRLLVRAARCRIA
jgi:DNA polymerase III subunit chi